MKMDKLHRLFALMLIISLSSMAAFAEVIKCDNVAMEYELQADGRIKVIKVSNSNDRSIELKIDGSADKTIKAHQEGKIEKYAKYIVSFGFNTGGGETLWKFIPQEDKGVEMPSATKTDTIGNKKEATSKKESKKPEKKVESKNKVENKAANETESIVEQEEYKPAPAPSISYAERLYKDKFFGTDAVNAYIQKVDNLCSGIESAADKSQFLIDNDVLLFLDSSSKEIAEKRDNLASTAQEIIRDAKVDVANQPSAVNVIIDALNSRLKQREDAYNKLNAIVADLNGHKSIIPDNIPEDILNYGVIGAIILLVIIITIVAFRRKKRSGRTPKKVSQPSASNESSADNSDIVVRRKTTSILKKQSIDDVIDNPAYLTINTSEFTPDSAVSKIYIKNSCIKDVYNLYAEDLRNTENPKEDGCMVLGRWVYDESSKTYDVSLEEIVLPGDDAVFKEYELNFGGKIKLRVAEKLRKLRRDTNLQYDLVCWIHSHPGLGVFFSNSDDNVQMQLKHSQHPNFLTAFVVDILTSDQEMGIFTFRKDGSMNSKGDIIKMYSLEEMYKWALQSERSTFSHDNYFNILDNAKLKLPRCKGVELNNNSIIDLTQILIEPETGIVGWAVGTNFENNGSQEYVVSNIVRNAEKPGTGVIGCLISMTHMSFPTIQRLIAQDSVNLSFVMVYSAKQMTLTSIPVINGELLSDEQFYGDVNIDDLKIWTRRKR